MDLEILAGLLDDVTYTLHFLLLLLRSGRIYDFERNSTSMMIVHFISGYV
jgi:hypothetical protein